MSAAPVFADTGLLLACFDARQPERRVQAQAWLSRLWQERRGRTSVQVLNEFYVAARRQFPTALAAGDARSELRRLQLWQPIAQDAAMFETAWAVESRHEIAYWDALVVAAAQVQGCGLLLSEKLPHEQRIDSLLVVNPFVCGPELLDA
jgi:predicted nucleic acid-binding protein